MNVNIAFDVFETAEWVSTDAFKLFFEVAELLNGENVLRGFQNSNWTICMGVHEFCQHCIPILGVVHAIIDVRILEAIWWIYVKWLQSISPFPTISYTVVTLIF